MEFLEGEDCAQLLERYGRLPPERAVDIVQQACRGLSVAHRAGIVHRDLKPENLFIARGGDGGDWVKVLDFGIAKLRVMDGGVPTRTGATLGTAYYMSPEQARGATDVDERTDVWSLGVVLYQLLSGQRPFQGAQFLHVVHQILSTDPVPLSTLQPELPQALLDVVAHAMAKEVAFRVGSAEALELALAPFSGRTTRRSDPPRARDQRARTQIARATSVGGVTIGDTGIGPRRDVGASAPVRKARTGKMLVLAGLGAAAAGATVAFIHSRSPRPSELSEVSSASLPAASPGAERKPPPPSALIAATAGPSVSTAPTSAAPVPRAAERGDQEPAPRPTVAVRTSSEHAARSSNTGAPSASPSVPVSAPARPAPAPATPEPNTSRDSTEKRAIEIEKGNPYE
jgi:serine/threonine-protein kinase